jgi:cytochrome P450
MSYTPGDAVVGYDPFTEEFQGDPFSVYRWMRDQAPVYRSDRWDFWALSRFDDVRAAAMDPQTFRSSEGIDIDDSAKDQSGPGYLPDIDNPRHDQLRKLVQRHFLPRSVAKLEDQVRQVVRKLVGQWQGDQVIDIAQELSWPLPYEVFFNLLGLPIEDRDDLIRWSHQLKDRQPDDPRLTPTATAATTNIKSYLARLLADRRLHPRDDLLTHLVTSQIDGVPLAEADIEPASEIIGLMFVLFLAGVETTAGLASTLFKALALFPEQRSLLRQDSSLIPAAVEEAARYESPLQVVGRNTTREVVLHGTRIPMGGRVLLVYGAANRDERQFPEPDRFDVTRGRVRHLGFGEGLHGCFGAPLARLEVKTALEEALPVLGEYELSEAPVRGQSTPNVYILAHLRVKTPARDGRHGRGSY